MDGERGILRYALAIQIIILLNSLAHLPMRDRFQLNVLCRDQTGETVELLAKGAVFLTELQCCALECAMRTAVSSFRALPRFSDR